MIFIKQLNSLFLINNIKYRNLLSKNSTMFPMKSSVNMCNKSNCENTIEQKHIINNKCINYVKSGQGKKTMLLLPGALGSAWTDFRPQIEKLPVLLDNYTVIAWDPPGYGQSIPPARTFTTNFFYNDADDAASLMKSLGYSEYSVLGWSDGGITGLILAAKNPDIIEKLIIWGANAYITYDETKLYENMRDVKKWSQRMREPMEKMYGAENFAKLWSNWIDALLEIYNKNNGDICKTELNKIKAPTLIVHGVKDPMLLTEHVPYLRNTIPRTEYFEFPDGKHNIHLRYADEFNSVVANFLRKDHSKSKL